MKTKDLVLNFVRQFKKPFTAETVSNMIAQDLSVIKPVLLELLTDKTIKLLSKQEGIYVLADRYSPSVCYNQKGDWKFEISAAAALLDQIGNGQYTSIRAIADDFGRSRQWVFVYMEALASIGCIGMEGKHYRVLKTDNVRNIGKKIEPGILGRMRPKISEEEKLRRAEEKEQKRLERLAQKSEREKRYHEGLKFSQLPLLGAAKFYDMWTEYIDTKAYMEQSFDQFYTAKMNK